MVSSRDGKTRIANTLDERFEALESKLLIEAGKVLFGN
jgi:vacuolar-type H+-ATPase subunit E/Vma4